MKWASGIKIYLLFLLYVTSMRFETVCETPGGPYVLMNRLDILLFVNSLDIFTESMSVVEIVTFMRING